MKLKFKNRMLLLRKIFFREKYRFDQGNAFLVFVNFSMLVATLVNLSGGNKQDIKYYITIGLVLTWFLGYILDRVIRVQDIQEKVSLKRSPIWKKNFEHHDQLSDKLEQLIDRLEKIENKIENSLDKNTP